MQRLSLFLIALSLPVLAAAASISNFAHRMRDAVNDFIATMTSAFTPSYDFATTGEPGLSLASAGGAVSASLFQRNRHEAGVSRRSADRHI